jgi:hypothetical protein
VLVAKVQAARGAWRSRFTMSVIGWKRPRMSYFTVNHLDMGHLVAFLARGGTGDVIHSKDEQSALHAPVLGHPR